MPIGPSADHRRGTRRQDARSGARFIAMACLAAAPATAWCQAPPAFRPNAGTVLNVYAPPGRQPELPASTLPTPAGDAAPAADHGATVRINGFELAGVSLLPLEDVQARLADLVGRDATLADLRSAAARVDELYRERGFFLARAWLPPQQIDDGIVRIAVIEGRYDGVEVSGSPRFDAARTQQTLAAQRVESGQPIERQALERGLILLEHRTGAPVTARLQPGATTGTSTLQVSTPSAALFSGSVGADNFGSRYTGQSRSTASLRLNSPLGRGDAGSLWYAHSSGADAVFVAYQAPVGHRGLMLGASYSDFSYELCCQYSALERAGDATVARVQARYPLRLSQRELLHLGLGLERRTLTDTWRGGVLDDRRLEVAILSLDGIAATEAGQLRYWIALSGGEVDLRGPASVAIANAATIDTAGHYGKLRGQVEWSHPLGRRSFLDLRLSGQFASRNLDSAEKFLLGGYDGVRAYPEGEAAGDEALLARVEWVWPLTLAALPGEASVRGFVDGGAVWIAKDLRGGAADPGIANQYSLSGTGLGLNWRMPRGLSLSAYVATRLGDNPGRSANGNDADGRDSRTRGWIGAEWAF
jgi:hemolysin activation/secretion protein